MASDTFWTTQGQDPFRRLIGSPLQDAATNPVPLLTGLRPDGMRDPQLGLNDATLFPRFDGVTNTVPNRPADFASPTADSFIRWHVGHQVEYLKTHGIARTSNDGPTEFPVREVSLGTNANQFLNLHAILGSDGRSVIVLNTLSQSDIAALPLADQRALASMGVFREHFAGPLGLLPDPLTPTIAGARYAMSVMVQERIDLITGAPGFLPGHDSDFLDNLDARYHYLFLNQLQILNAQLRDMAVFNPDAIRREADAIITRFARLERYMSATEEQIVPNTTLRAGVNSSDNLASVRSARQILTGIELRLHDLAVAARDLALTGVFEGRRVDTPDMIFLFQTFQNYSNEAEAEARSEDLKQIQRLLQDYTLFQRMLNATLRSYDPVALADPDTTEKKALTNQTGESYGNFSAEDRAVMFMFDAALVAGVAGNSFHPMETRISLIRPVENIVNRVLNTVVPVEHPKTIWDALARNVADATRFLNQDTQVLMDEISKLNKQKNRNYDLATNTLNKMTDILRSVIN